MIRPRIVAAANTALASGPHFKADDFSVATTSREDGSGTLEIRYRFDDAYVFHVELPNTGYERTWLTGPKLKITGFTSPGFLTSRENVLYEQIPELIAGITGWTERIHEEMLAVPVNRRLAEHRDQLDGLIAQIGDLPDEYFTREEADALRARLDELESQMRANIEGAASSADVDARLSELHADIELLKRSAESLKKQGWAGSLMVRLKRWSANPENRDLLKSGAAVARTFLLPDGGSPRHTARKRCGTVIDLHQPRAGMAHS